MRCHGPQTPPHEHPIWSLCSWPDAGGALSEACSSTGAHMKLCTTTNFKCGFSSSSILSITFSIMRQWQILALDGLPSVKTLGSKVPSLTPSAAQPMHQEWCNCQTWISQCRGSYKGTRQQMDNIIIGANGFGVSGHG